MNLKVLSDLHLEFEKPEDPIFDPGKGEVLILAGDIITVADLIDDVFDLKKRFLSFFQKCSENYNKVFYVMGNHEHYHMDISQTIEVLKFYLPENFTILDDNSEYYEGVHFVGSTVWADFCDKDPEMMDLAYDRMNDYQTIRMPNGILLQPEDTLELHQNSVHWFNQVLPTLRGPVVMVTHHAPSYRSVSTKFLHTGTVGAYASDLEPLMYTHENIKLWVHGHVHDNNDYYVNNTRVVGNPRGYVRPGGTNDNFNSDLIITV